MVLWKSAKGRPILRHGPRYAELIEILARLDISLTLPYLAFRMSDLTKTHFPSSFVTITGHLVMSNGL